MSISNFNDLLNAAKYQSDPQRLLFVFVSIEQPEQANDKENQVYQSGRGGHLIPLACVDKTPDELEHGFEQLSAEADNFILGWDMVFVGALGGSQPEAPSSELAQPYLDQMIEMIKIGRVASLNLFDKQGQAVMLHATTDYENFEPTLFEQAKNS